MNNSARRLYLGALILVMSVGCTTTRKSDTARTGLEQLLISNAVDQALDKVDVSVLRQHAVYLEEKYFDSVDKNYIIGSIRHRVLQSGAKLVDKPDDADVILEVRSGGVGTDNMERFLGIPEIALPVPLPVQFPEVRLFARSTQIGTAKIGLVAYDAKTRRAVGDAGVVLARSDDNNWSVLGIGPINRGSVRDEVLAASESVGSPVDLVTGLARRKSRANSNIQLASPVGESEQESMAR